MTLSLAVFVSANNKAGVRNVMLSEVEALAECEVSVTCTNTSGGTYILDCTNKDGNDCSSGDDDNGVPYVDCGGIIMNCK